MRHDLMLIGLMIMWIFIAEKNKIKTNRQEV